MNRKSFLKRALAIVMTLVMTAGIVLIAAPEGAYAASPYRLVNKVNGYYKDGSRWKKDLVIKYTYNKKGDPVKINTKRVSGYKYSKIDTYTYTYKSGKKVKAKHYVKEGDASKYLAETLIYDSKGRLKKIENSYGWSETFTYGKNGYITKVKSEDWTRTNKYTWNGKVAKSMKVKMSDYPGYVYETTFTKQGYILAPVSRTEANGVQTYSYSFKSGRINKIDRTTADGYKRYYDRYVISYTNKSINRNRYMGMINEMLVGYPVNTGMPWF